MKQINARAYELLKIGTKGKCFLPNREPVDVVFKGMDGVTVLIEGKGIRSKWHQGLHAGLLQSLFDWEVE